MSAYVSLLSPPFVYTGPFIITSALLFHNHIHFIDGGDGGYAIAAKQLKGQMKSA